MSEKEAEFEYDELDRLTSAQVGAAEASFDYSIDGYRYFKLENGSYPEFCIYDETTNVIQHFMYYHK